MWTGIRIARKKDKIVKYLIRHKPLLSVILTNSPCKSKWTNSKTNSENSSPQSTGVPTARLRMINLKSWQHCHQSYEFAQVGDNRSAKTAAEMADGSRLTIAMSQVWVLCNLLLIEKSAVVLIICLFANHFRNFCNSYTCMYVCTRI